MVKLALDRNIVEIEIEDMNFEVNLSDQELINFQNQYDEAGKKIRKIEAAQVNGEEDMEETITNISNYLSTLYDALLGEGAYEKLYAYSGSVYILVNLLFDIVNASMKEIERKNKEKLKKSEKEQQQLSASYLNKKRKAPVSKQ